MPKSRRNQLLMLKDSRVRLVLVALVVLIVAVGTYLFYDNIIVSSQTGPVNTGVPVAPTLALKPRSSNTPSALNDSRFIGYTFPVANAAIAAAPLAQGTNFYPSCTDDRRSTATPTGAAPAAATAAATMDAATPAPTAAATAAASAPSDAVLFEIVGTESQACYQVGEVFINRNNQFGLAVGVSTAISGQVAIDRNNVANSQLGQIVVDISQLQSDSSSRDGQIRRRWLESNTYPLAKFTPTELVGLPARAYQEGETLTFIARGALNIRNVDRPTDFKVTATLKDGILYGTAVVDVKMSDWKFDAPEIAGTLKANEDVRVILNFVAREPKK
jgi:polyisoprenoid-binding protein YceI